VHIGETKLSDLPLEGARVKPAGFSYTPDFLMQPWPAGRTEKNQSVLSLTFKFRLDLSALISFK